MNPNQIFLQRTIQLARKGGVFVQPNPMVGAVIVYQEKIIGEGYHQFPGGPHAEVNAIRAVADQTCLPSAAMYVSLEPCAHVGKTPPCADLIIRHNIPRVIIGCVDPNPKVSGKGIKRMRNHGVEVIMAEDPSPFVELNRIFFTRMHKQRPYLCLKWAESGDGFIAGLDHNRYPERTAITGIESSRLVHQLRASFQGILIGSRTAIVDNPSLTTRHFPGSSPIRIVWNTNSQALPASLQLFQEPPTSYVLEKHSASPSSISIPNHSPQTIVETLASLDIHSCLIEGGRNTLQGFLDAGLFDEIYRFKNPDLLLGQGVPAPAIPSGPYQKVSRQSGEDRLEHFSVPVEG